MTHECRMVHLVELIPLKELFPTFAVQSQGILNLQMCMRTAPSIVARTFARMDNLFVETLLPGARSPSRCSRSGSPETCAESCNFLEDRLGVCDTRSV